MRIVAGNVVTGDDFFKDRLVLVERLEERLEFSDILVIGPRRTGKTSLIKEYLRQQEEKNKNFKSIFLNLEQTQNLYDFYIRIIREILHAVNKWKLYQHDTERVIKSCSTRLNEILGDGVNIGVLLGLPPEMSPAINFPKFEAKKIIELRQQLGDIIRKITIPVVIVLDEFPELIWKLGKDESKEDQKAIRKEQTELMLAGLRALRQELDGSRTRHKIIIAGSVNLPITLEHLDLDNLINDIEKLEIPNLIPEEGIKLFNSLIAPEEFKFEGFNSNQFIEQQFGAIAPFFIQVFANSLVQMRIDRGKGIIFSLEDFITCYKELMVTPGIRYLKNRIERYYDRTETVYAILSIIAKNQFQNNSNTSEEECLEWVKSKTGIDLPRDQQTDLLAQMQSDDLMQIQAEKFYFSSRLLCNFWHYTLVGSQFLTSGR